MSETNKPDSIPSIPLFPAKPTIPQCPPTPPFCDHHPVVPCPPPACPPNPCDHHHGERRHRPLWCGPVDTCRPGEFYDTACPPPIPPEGYTMEALKPYVPGLSVERQMEYLYNNMNNLIHIFNQANEKVFGAYQAVVNSAMCNNAYYNDICTEVGYFKDTNVAYKLTRIPFIDCTGQPIYFELGLPNNATLNEGLTENCYSASRRVLADKLIPATQTGKRWKGWTIYRKSPISKPNPPVLREDDSIYYTFAVTRNGFFKWYAADVSLRTLNCEEVVNAMNCSAVLVNNKEITESLFSEVGNQTLARVAVGMNYHTKERFIVVVDGSEQTGCTEKELAEIFAQRGCDMAVQLAYSTSAFGMDKGLMEFVPPTVDSDIAPTMPDVSGFWYITKERHYHNEFVREVAELTQRMGEQMWYDWINADSIDYVKDRLKEVVDMITKETEDRIEGDQNLSDRIDAIDLTRIDRVENIPIDANKDAWYLIKNSGEKVLNPIITYNYDRLYERLSTYDNFDQSLQSEIAARQAGDDALRSLITATNTALEKETNDRIQADNELRNIFSDPNSEIMTLIREVETRLQGNINSEATARANADTQLGDRIDTMNELIRAETEARTSGDADLSTAITNLRTEYQAFVTNTEGDITTLEDAVRQLNTQLSVSMEDINTRLTTAEGDIETLKNSNNDLIARMASLNTAVTALQNTFLTLETSFDNIKASFSEVLAEFHTLKEEWTNFQAGVIGDIKSKLEDGPWLDNLNLSGGTPGLAVNLRTDANGVFFSKPGDDGADALAEVKVGEPTTESSSVPLGYLTDEIAETIAAAHNYTDQKFEEALKPGGVVDEYALSKDGGTMRGTINMDGNKITNLPAPADLADAATKEYVDNAIADIPKGDYLELTGGEMSGDINMGGNKIANAADPTAEKDLATKGYVDNKFIDVPLGDYLETSGGTMTGNITFNGGTVTGIQEPTTDNDAANKKYVDDLIQNTQEAGEDAYLKKSGDTMLGNLVLGAVETSTVAEGVTVDSVDLVFNTSLDGSTYIKQEAYEDNGKPHLSFGTETSGEHVVVRGVDTPVGAYDVANKDYVDNHVPDITGFVKQDGSVPMTGNLNMGDNSVVGVGAGVTDNDAVNLAQLKEYTRVESSIFGEWKLMGRYRGSQILNFNFTAETDIEICFTHIATATPRPTNVRFGVDAKFKYAVIVGTYSYTSEMSLIPTSIMLKKGETLICLNGGVSNDLEIEMVYREIKPNVIVSNEPYKGDIFGRGIIKAHDTSLVADRPTILNVWVDTLESEVEIKINNVLVGYTGNQGGHPHELTVFLNKGDVLTAVYNTSTIKFYTMEYYLNIPPLIPVPPKTFRIQLPSSGWSIDGERVFYIATVDNIPPTMVPQMSYAPDSADLGSAEKYDEYKKIAFVRVVNDGFEFNCFGSAPNTDLTVIVKE